MIYNITQQDNGAADRIGVTIDTDGFELASVQGRLARVAHHSHLSWQRGAPPAVGDLIRTCGKTYERVA